MTTETTVPPDPTPTDAAPTEAPPAAPEAPQPFTGGRVAKFDDPANPGVILIIDVDHLVLTGAQAPSVHGLSFASPVSGQVMKLDVDHWNAQAPAADAEAPSTFTPGEIRDDTGAVVGGGGATVPPDVAATPKAAELAASTGVDLSAVEGTGAPVNKVTVADVKAAAQEQGTPTEAEPQDEGEGAPPE